MDPFQQYTGLPLLWIYLSSAFVFLFGIWQTRYLSRKLSISQFKGLGLYLWHTLFCILHYFWVNLVQNDVLGNYLGSLDPSFDFYGEENYLSNFFILYFYRIFSYYLKFSFFTTFLTINLIGTNAILLVEYFYNKLSIEIPKILKSILGLFIWLPTFHFWTVLGKDSLVILSLLLITYALENLKNRYLFILPALVVVTCLRSYIAIMVVIAALLSIFLTSSTIKKVTKIALTIFSSLSFFLIYPIVKSFLFERGENIFDVFSYNVYITSLGTYAISPDMNPLLRVLAYNFRPLFFDSRNLFGLILSFENLILALIFIYSMFVILIKSNLKISIPNQFPMFCAAFSLSVSFLLAQSTSNLGIASRHKWMFLPIGFIYLLIIMKNIFYKKRTNPKKINNSMIS